MLTYNICQIPANNFVINNSWDVDGKSKNVADTVGLMVYEGAGVITLLHIFLFGFVQMTK